jgi:hypothetical protein
MLTFIKVNLYGAMIRDESTWYVNDNGMFAVTSPAMIDQLAGQWANANKGSDNWIGLRIERTSVMNEPGTVVKEYRRSDLEALMAEAIRKEALANMPPVMLQRGNSTMFGCSKEMAARGSFLPWLSMTLLSRGYNLRGIERDEPAYPGFQWWRCTDATGNPLVFVPPSTDELIMPPDANGITHKSTWAQEFVIDGVPYQVDTIGQQQQLDQISAQVGILVSQLSAQMARNEELEKQLAAKEASRARASAAAKPNGVVA